jgi:hypothetical protein
LNTSLGNHDSRVVKTVRSLKKMRPESAQGNSSSQPKLATLPPRTTLAPLPNLLNSSLASHRNDGLREYGGGTAEVIMET